MHKFVKGKLLTLFENRNCTTKGETTFCVKVTINAVLDELYACINENVWLDYFAECPSYMGENWIDFESEIAKVIRALNVGKMEIFKEGTITGISEKSESRILMSLVKKAKSTLKTAYGDEEAINKFGGYLYKELERLIRALEIYIDEFVNKIPINIVSGEIMSIK